MAASDPRGWMWKEALAVIEQAEHLHRRFFEPGFSALQAAVWEPPVDIFEADEELLIVVALPGVEPEDLDVSIDAGTLRVAGQRRLPAIARDAIIRRLEIPYGRFERQIQLPSARLALGRSELVNGCLVVGLTKRS
jgi:HSP20 family molecular chaperone IbpA